MRIVHVNTYYYPTLGGLERVVQYLAEEQAKLGHEVHVISSGGGGLDREDLINNVHVHRVRSFRMHFPDLTIPLEIPETLLKNVDLVHVHSQNSLFNVRILVRAKRIGTKTACHFMAVNSFNDHPNPLVRLLAPQYGKWTVKTAVKYSDLRLVKSHRDREILRERFGVDSEYVPDGVPDYYINYPKNNSGNFWERYGIYSEHVFLYIGRIHFMKGPHILLNALKYIDKRDIAIAFIGPDGGYLGKLRRRIKELGIKDRVHLIGRVDEKTKIQAIDHATALVVPSISDYAEVFSLVISEAWAREKPVIASRVGELAYRVKHGVNGLLVDPGNSKALADAMTMLMEDASLAHRLGQEGKKSVLSWKEVAVKAIELYKAILNDKLRGLP